MPKDKSTAARRVKPERLAPRFGEHSVEVLREGGFSEEEIAWAVSQTIYTRRSRATDGVTR